jgi:hypothetical protein
MSRSIQRGPLRKRILCHRLGVVCARVRLPGLLTLGLGAVVLLAGGVWLRASYAGREHARRIASLDALLALPAPALARVDITRMNLLCARGLAGADGLDLKKVLQVSA